MVFIKPNTFIILCEWWEKMVPNEWKQQKKDTPGTDTNKAKRALDLLKEQMSERNEKFLL